MARPPRRQPCCGHLPHTRGGALPLKVDEAARGGGANGRRPGLPKRILGAVEVASGVVAGHGARLLHPQRPGPRRPRVGLPALPGAEGGGPHEPDRRGWVAPLERCCNGGALGTQLPAALVASNEPNQRAFPKRVELRGGRYRPSYDPISRSSIRRMLGWRYCRAAVGQVAAAQPARSAAQGYTRVTSQWRAGTACNCSCTRYRSHARATNAAAPRAAAHMAATPSAAPAEP